MLDHDDIKKMLPYRNQAVLIDEITELECQKYAKGRYYLVVPEKEGDLRIRKVQSLLIQSLLETAGVIVFCNKVFQGKLMDILKMESLTYNVEFQQEVLALEEYRILEIETEVELINIKNKYAHAKGRAKHKDMIIIESDFFFWLLSSEELMRADGMLPEIDDKQ